MWHAFSFKWGSLASTKLLLTKINKIIYVKWNCVEKEYCRMNNRKYEIIHKWLTRYQYVGYVKLSVQYLYWIILLLQCTWCISCAFETEAVVGICNQNGYFPDNGRRFYHSLSIAINILVCFCALAGVVGSDNWKIYRKRLFSVFLMIMIKHGWCIIQVFKWIKSPNIAIYNWLLALLNLIVVWLSNENHTQGS